MLTLRFLLVAFASSACAQDVASTTSTQQSLTGTQSTTASTTATTTAAPDLSEAVTGFLFLNYSEPATGWDASIVCADASDTTYVLGCAATGNGNALCRASPAVLITVTARPTNYDLFYSTGGVLYNGRGTVTQSCDFGGPWASATQVVCSLSGQVAIGGTTAAVTSTIETLGLEAFPPTASIPITLGQTNSASDCPASGAGAPAYTPAQSSAVEVAGAAPTNAAGHVYKVLVPVGVAVVALAGV